MKIKWAAVLFGIFIIFIIVMANMNLLGIMGFINKIPFGDKVGHFLLYGMLTLLVDLSFIRSHRDRSPELVVLRVALILAFAIGLEEYSQRFFKSRTPSWADLFSSYLGVIAFSLAALQKGRDRP